MSDHCLLNVLQAKPCDRTPVWFMRQAGRHLPEYRRLRAKTQNFMAMCRNPQLACEVTLQPVQRYDLDAAIIFSDILTLPDAMGMQLYFVEREGPKFQQPLDMDAVSELDVAMILPQLDYVMEAVALTKQRLAGRAPLIGFAGSPWTLACYMVEGGSSKQFDKVRALMHQSPQQLHQLLSFLTDLTVAYLKAQRDAGAEVVMVFDTWGGLLSPHGFDDFNLPYLRRIGESLADNAAVPSLLFSKQCGPQLDKMARLAFEGLGVDWTYDLRQARMQVGPDKVLQGNLDPTALLGDRANLEKEVQRILQHTQGTPHIVNLGHGILPNTAPEQVQAVIDVVRAFEAE
jgi:uroporphyrinogen decarboxylase